MNPERRGDGAGNFAIGKRNSLVVSTTILLIDDTDSVRPRQHLLHRPIGIGNIDSMISNALNDIPMSPRKNAIDQNLRSTVNQKPYSGGCETLTANKEMSFL